jgi:hypothetical protein
VTAATCGDRGALASSAQEVAVHADLARAIEHVDPIFIPS